jgi:hypothetical protein
LKLTAEARIAFAIQVLRACRSDLLTSHAKYPNYGTLQRADGFLFAIQLLDPDAPEATEWSENMRKIVERVD